MSAALLLLEQMQSTPKWSEGLPVHGVHEPAVSADYGFNLPASYFYEDRPLDFVAELTETTVGPEEFYYDLVASSPKPVLTNESIGNATEQQVVAVMDYYDYEYQMANTTEAAIASNLTPAENLTTVQQIFASATRAMTYYRRPSGTTLAPLDDGDTYSFPRLPFLVVDSLTTLLALLSSVLVVIAISRTKLSTPMVGYHRFILSLAVACLLTTCAVSLSFVHEIVLYNVPHPALTRKCGETLIKSVMDIGFGAALLSIAGLALDSFIGLFFDAELYNLTTKRRTREITVIIWFFSLGFGLTDLPLSIVHFFSTGGHEMKKSRDTDFLDWCTIYIANKYRLEYALIGVSLPCFIFIFATIARLAMEVRRSEVCWNPTNSDRRWVFRRFVTTTFLLMCLFSIFWLPHTILDVSIVLTMATFPQYQPPNAATLEFVRYLLRSWLMLGLLSIPVAYAIRFRRRVRRQLVDFFVALCSRDEGNVAESAEEEEQEEEAPTIRHLLASSSLVGYGPGSGGGGGGAGGGAFDDSHGSFRTRGSRRKALQRVKSCRV